MHYVGQTTIDPSRADMTYMHMVSTGLPGDVGYFVVGSLVALALFRRRLRSTSDLDRPGSGWTLGWVWVGMALLSWSRVYLILLR